MASQPRPASTNSRSGPGGRWPYPGMDWLAGALLGIVMTLLLRRYVGINHDAVAYLGQALVQQWPDIYGNDLFFVHGGSQDQYTLFPSLLAVALQSIGPATLFLWCTLACLLLFAMAGWFCLKGLLPAGQRYWAWLGVICLPTMYGKAVMFSYSEPFFTPRPLAELLSLLGIGLLARERWIGAATAFAVAAMFHPLQAIAAGIVAWAWAVGRDRRWLHALWLAIPIAMLALAKLGPFGGLLQQADPDWLFVLRDNTPQLFMGTWETFDFTMLVLDALVLAYCRKSLPGTFGSWCGAALAGLLLGIAASGLLVDILHLVLPAGLQLWRVHWLAHWFAMAGIAALLHRDLQSGQGPRALLLCFTALLAWGQSDWIWLLPAAFYAAWPAVMTRASARMATLLGWALGVGALLLFANHAYSEFTLFRIAHYRLDLYAFDRRLLVQPLLALGLPLLALWSWRRAGRRMQLTLLACVICPLVVVAIWRWDLRPPQVLGFEQAAFDDRAFGVDIPENAQVLWGHDMLIGPWLVLRRASFFSANQLSGQVFNRHMAMDGRQRLNRVYPLLEQYLGCQDRSRALEERERCHIDDDAMRQACAPGPELRPDYIVLPYLQPQRAVGAWTIMDPVTDDAEVTWRLYRCTDVMADLQSGKETAR